MQNRKILLVGHSENNRYVENILQIRDGFIGDRIVKELHGVRYEFLECRLDNRFISLYKKSYKNSDGIIFYDVPPANQIEMKADYGKKECFTFDFIDHAHLKYTLEIIEKNLFASSVMNLNSQDMKLLSDSNTKGLLFANLCVHSIFRTLNKDVNRTIAKTFFDLQFKDKPLVFELFKTKQNREKPVILKTAPAEPEKPTEEKCSIM